MKKLLTVLFAGLLSASILMANDSPKSKEMNENPPVKTKTHKTKSHKHTEKTETEKGKEVEKPAK